MTDIDVETIRQKKIKELGIIVLNDGTYLFKDNTKYGSNLCFITKDIVSDPDTFNMKLQDLNLKTGTSVIKAMIGNFFIGENGDQCFYVVPNGKHWLLSYSWGGDFNKDLGKQLFELPNKLYEKRTSMDNGISGYDFVVVPVGTKYQINDNI